MPNDLRQRNQQWFFVGSAETTPVWNTKRVVLDVRIPKTNFELFYHYDDNDLTPVRGVAFNATFDNGERRRGVLDQRGRALLEEVPNCAFTVEYQPEAADENDPRVQAARAELKAALDAIVAQTKRDMAEEQRRWDRANEAERESLKRNALIDGAVGGAKDFVVGTFETIAGIGKALQMRNQAMVELAYMGTLYMKGQWREFDNRLSEYRAKGDRMLEAACELKELLILVFHDRATRDAIEAFGGRWIDAVPPHEKIRLVTKEGTPIVIDIVIAVLLAAFSVGAGGAAYGGAKWARRVGKLKAEIKGLLDRLEAAFKQLAKALKEVRRKTVEYGQKAAKVVETKWKEIAEIATKLRARRLEKLDGGHSLDRHGPEVSDADLRKRLTTGVTPDNKFSPAPASTKFSSYEEWEKTRTDALEKISRDNGIDLTKPPKPGEKTYYEVTLDHGRAIDEGFVGDVSSRTRASDPANPSKRGWVYSKSTPVDGITRTFTGVEWDDAAGRWRVTQHFPEARGWNQTTQSYAP